MPLASTSQAPLILQTQRTSKNKERKKRNNLQVRAMIDSRSAAAKQPHCPRGCSSRAMQAKRKNYVPELCNQRNCTALSSCTTNLRTQGVRDSGPPPTFVQKLEDSVRNYGSTGEKITCKATKTRAHEKRKSSIPNPRPLFTRKRGDSGDHRGDIHPQPSIPARAARGYVIAFRHLEKKKQFHLDFT
jgi:hypothetical protein